jgi:hypothetical protein
MIATKDEFLCAAHPQPKEVGTLLKFFFNCDVLCFLLYLLMLILPTDPSWIQRCSRMKISNWYFLISWYSLTVCIDISVLCHRLHHSSNQWFCSAAQQQRLFPQSVLLSFLWSLCVFSSFFFGISHFDSCHPVISLRIRLFSRSRPSLCDPYLCLHV